jgi:hypothetical protein
MTTQNPTGLASCYEVISRLDAQLSSARRLRDLLESGAFRDNAEWMCERMLDDAVNTARAVADLRETVCADRSVKGSDT